MWILGAEADDAAGAASIGTVSGLVTQQGGQMVDAEPWGRRTLSFPIKRNKEGSYFLAHFTMPRSQAPGFERALNANQDIIRYLLVIPDERVPGRRESKRSGPGRAEAGTPATAS
jgi:small subunit ribosomal protein S6